MDFLQGRTICRDISGLMRFCAGPVMALPVQSVCEMGDPLKYDFKNNY